VSILSLGLARLHDVTLTTTFARFGATNAVASGLAYLVINRFGRRSLLLLSLVSMFPFLLLTGHFLDQNSTGSEHQEWVIALLVMIYTALYSPGAGVSFLEIRDREDGG
jgi:Sugar (and other) transporter